MACVNVFSVGSVVIYCVGWEHDFGCILKF